MSVTAVARVQKFAPQDSGTQIQFYPAYDNPENHVWATSTPALSVSMYVKNEIADLFDTSKEYLITFEARD